MPCNRGNISKLQIESGVIVILTVSGNGGLGFKMTVCVEKISLHALDEGISKHDMILLEKMFTNGENASYLEFGNTKFKKVGILFIYQ